MSDYFKEREREMNMRLRQLREELPEFAEEFFVGIEPRTTVLTRRQAVALRNHLRRADPTAFLTIVNSSEIVGKGFRSL